MAPGSRRGAAVSRTPVSVLIMCYCSASCSHLCLPGYYYCILFTVCIQSGNRVLKRQPHSPGIIIFYFLSSNSAANARAAQSCHFLPAVISFQNGGIFLTPNLPQFFSFSFLLTFLLFYLSKTEWSENKRFLSEK